MKDNRKILITGVAGFIGFHLSRRLLNDGFDVIGIDNVNDYYDVNLKEDRLKMLGQHDCFKFYREDLVDNNTISRIFKEEKAHTVVNLAAQAGVRYSIENPQAYLNSNIQGFLNVIEGCRHNEAKHLIYASSSSVYGANKTAPFSVHQNVDHPISLYAATKKSNELFAHTYSALFDLPTTGLRFFTVYGPFGRPDMALFLFTKAILEGKEIDVFNHGKMKRSFTYIDDIVEGIRRLIDNIPTPSDKWDAFSPDPSLSFAPYNLFNIGNNQSIELTKYISLVEDYLGKKAKKNMLPLQPGDVPESSADIQDLEEAIGYKPNTSVEVGIKNFIAWYRDYYKV